MKAGRSKPNGASRGGLMGIGIMFLVLGITMDNMAAFIGVGVVFMALAGTKGSGAEGDADDVDGDDGGV